MQTHSIHYLIFSIKIKPVSFEKQQRTSFAGLASPKNKRRFSRSLRRVLCAVVVCLALNRITLLVFLYIRLGERKRRSFIVSNGRQIVNSH